MIEDNAIPPKANGITYKEAAKQLKTKPGNIASAVYYGNLTQIPSKGKERLVIAEQVKLFEGKTAISKKLLTPQEYQTWKLFDAAYGQNSVGQNTPVRDLSQEVADAVAVQQLAKYGPEMSLAHIAKQAIPSLQALLSDLEVIAKNDIEVQKKQGDMQPVNP